MALWFEGKKTSMIILTEEDVHQIVELIAFAEAQRFPVEPIKTRFYIQLARGGKK